MGLQSKHSGLKTQDVAVFLLGPSTILELPAFQGDSQVRSLCSLPVPCLPQLYTEGGRPMPGPPQQGFVRDFYHQKFQPCGPWRAGKTVPPQFGVLQFRVRAEEGC
ncbi:hypothetical protein TREES_T100000783 [Tupaia chinensis]|uniref:Uncharacterized protein n=1 Tax=Tupaia chinensis TaxID=246437 RepID=L9KIN0_TUPCH|nr:hypothetical protein TREES_T100000783 [Tupaia chinensis]